MRKNAIIRIRIITGAVLFLALILIVRLYQIQIMQHDIYQEKAERQYVHTVRDLYSRGSIYFSTKADEKVSAATVQSGYLLSIDPTRIEDEAFTYEQINSVYALDEETFLLRAGKKERTYYEIASELSEAQADDVEALDLNGVQLYRDQ